VSQPLPATERSTARRSLQVMTARMVLPALVFFLAAVCPLTGCSKSTEAGAPPADETLPDPAASGVKTPEQAAQEAKAGINASNAEAELQKLEQEIGGG
jgi:hypothetical protein